MRSILVLMLLVASSSLVLAQNWKGGGDGFSLGKGGRIPCFKGVRPTKELRQVLNCCHKRVEADIYSKYPNLTSSTDMIEDIKKEKEESLADCIMINAGYVMDNGSLNIEKIMEHVDDIEAKNFLPRIRMISIGHFCALNISGDNATEQFRGFMSCVREKTEDHCDRQEEKLEAYLQKVNETSPCASVELPAEIYEIYGTCFAETRQGDLFGTNVRKRRQSKRGRPNKSNRRRGKGRPNGGRGRPNGGSKQTSIEEEMALPLCVAEGLGTYSPESGYNYTRLIENINNLTGWEEIPEILANLTTVMEACIPTYKGGDLFAQIWEWESCVTLPVIDICGFSNTATRMITYELDNEIVQIAKAYGRQYGDDSKECDEDDEDCDDSEEDEDGPRRRPNRGGGRKNNKRGNRGRNKGRKNNKEKQSCQLLPFSSN